MNYKCKIKIWKKHEYKIHGRTTWIRYYLNIGTVGSRYSGVLCIIMRCIHKQNKFSWSTELAGVQFDCMKTWTGHTSDTSWRRLEPPQSAYTLQSRTQYGVHIEKSSAAQLNLSESIAFHTRRPPSRAQATHPHNILSLGSFVFNISLTFMYCGCGTFHSIVRYITLVYMLVYVCVCVCVSEERTVVCVQRTRITADPSWCKCQQLSSLAVGLRMHMYVCVCFFLYKFICSLYS